MTIAQSSPATHVTGRDPYFNAVLQPYRSLGRQGFVWLMLCVSLVMIVVSIPFFAMGAWPVLGFAGLDVALLYWAFRHSYRDAHAREQVTITPDQVLVSHVSPKGEKDTHAFNPYWVRLETMSEEDKGMTGLFLTSHGRTVEIGAFLHANEREELAHALKLALSRAKSGVEQVSGG